MKRCWAVWFLTTTHSLAAFQPTAPVTRYKVSWTPITTYKLSSAVIKRGGYFMVRKDTKIRLCSETPSFADRFSRWRFMQELLDGDIDDDLINVTLFSVLNTHLQNLQLKSPSNERAGPSESTRDLIVKLEGVLRSTQGETMIKLFTEEPDDKELLKKLEDLLPDPQEDEDAHKSNWDIMMEIYGHDLVKSNEQNPTPKWRKLSLAARLLIHYDFITRGTD